MKRLLILVFLSFASAENPVEEFTTANNLFGQSVYQKISKTQPGNFLVSPFSAEAVLAFLQSGTKGETGEELRTALHLPNDKNQVETALKSLLPKFKSDDFYTLHSANKMYVKKDFEIKSEFKNAATHVYEAEIEDIDFSKNKEAAKIINDWVEKHTNNKIKNLVDFKILDDDSRLLLVNALYFKGNWSTPFSPFNTDKKTFFKTSKDSLEVDTLQLWNKEFRYYECPHLNAQFLELPFEGDEAVMVVVLPREKDGLTSLENQLDQALSPQHEFNSVNVNVALPKFKIKSKINFVEVLKSLGVSKVFDEKHADLSGISGNKGDLIVSQIIQKTFIDVDEKGVEAAAATFALGIRTMSAVYPPPPPPKNFIADHPFIFYIKVKGVVIFAGRVTDPSSS